jgi:flagellar biosynthesis protein FlhA
MSATTSSPRVSSFQNLFRSKDLALGLGVIIIVGSLLITLPSGIVDLLLAVNIAMAVGILLLTLYITQPMDFSVFPTILLLITLFRLSLNISTARLILNSGDAGKVVATFGNLLIGNNYVVGVVIFLMLMIIQFVVINNGAGRVAEVAARFTLDAMPGKQLAIDADLNAGLIDEGEARRRRKQIETEADFYGAMDGSSKFVKGDAVAAIIIMIVNIVGGFIIGMVQRSMDFVTALQTYTLLTIGAGLSIQIPALLISAASGLIVTRTTSDTSLGTDIFKQLSNFNSLAVGSIITALLIFVPGLPKLPFIGVSCVLGVAAYFVQREQKVEKVETPIQISKNEAETPEDMLEMVVVDPVELEIGYGLIPMIDEASQENLLRRITGIRRQLMSELGVVLPIVRIRDNLRLQPQMYRVKIRGQDVSHGDLFADRLLAIPSSEASDEVQGIKTTEPAFGLPAYWIAEPERGRAELMGYTVVNPISVISTHLLEIFRSHAADLLNRQMVQEMLNQLKSKAPASVDGVVPDLLSLGEVQAVLRNLLSERMPIRDLQGILEVLANNANVTHDPSILAEAVRQTMSNTISSLYRDENDYIHVITLSPQLESTLRSSLGQNGNEINFQIDTSTAQKVIAKTGEQMEKLAQTGNLPIILLSRELRLAYRRMVERVLPNLVVLAFSEVGPGTKVRSHGMVEIE